MKILTKCPACSGKLVVRALQCADCGMELRNEFEVSAFDQMEAEEMGFLLCFLRCRGNLKEVQERMQMSYPAAKKRLDSVLESLGLHENETEKIDLENLVTDEKSAKASEIIKTKLKEAGGFVEVRTLNGKLREIRASPNGKEFLCPQMIPYSYEIFDSIVDLLLKSPGYRAPKGNARMAKLGEPGCEENTIAGAILLFLGKKPGESGLDPAFILAAVLDWAGIVHNERGYVQLTAEYAARINNNE